MVAKSSENTAPKAPPKPIMKNAYGVAGGREGITKTAMVPRSHIIVAITTAANAALTTLRFILTIFGFHLLPLRMLGLLLKGTCESCIEGRSSRRFCLSVSALCIVLPLFQISDCRN